MTTQPHIFSVSEFNEALRVHLELLGEVAIQGEVSGYNTARGNMIFFDLKDATSHIRCFALRWELSVPLRDGMEIRVLGVPSVFRKNTGLHIRVSAIELVGQGALQQALLALRAKLETEGLFAPERKRDLPAYPETIGLITSPDAAAYTDVVHKLADRWPLARVVFAPVAVQGLSAVREIVSAFDLLNRDGRAEVIILTRGGGSLEDLQSFNDERVARAIYGSDIPVVCGVGHERDWTIADEVADRRAATPTNAAEIVVPDRREVAATVNRLADGLADAIQRQQSTATELVQQQIMILRHAASRQTQDLRRLSRTLTSVFRMWYHTIAAFRQSVPRLAATLTTAATNLLTASRVRLDERRRLLASLSPKATLQRGYSITRVGDKLLRSVGEATAGSEIETELADGTIESTIHPKHEPS